MFGARTYDETVPNTSGFVADGGENLYRVVHGGSHAEIHWPQCGRRHILAYICETTTGDPLWHDAAQISLTELGGCRRLQPLAADELRVVSPDLNAYPATPEEYNDRRPGLRQEVHGSHGP